MQQLNASIPSYTPRTAVRRVPAGRSFSDLRRCRRIQCQQPLWLKNYAQGDEAYQLAEIRNISVGGAYVLSHGPHQLGQRLTLTLEVPKTAHLLKLRATIVHLSHRQGGYYCGLSFGVDGRQSRQLPADLIEHFKSP